MGNEKPAEVKSNEWQAIRQTLDRWDKPEIVALVKILYDAASNNRDLIHAHCQDDPDRRAETLEKYRGKIEYQFYGKGRGSSRPQFGPLKLAEAHKAIREYRKATGDLAGTAELMMSMVEYGVTFTMQYGDIDERYYSSVERALRDLTELLRGELRALYPMFSERLATVEHDSSNVGWGFHDYIADQVMMLSKEFEKPGK